MTVYLLYVEYPSWQTGLSAHWTVADRNVAIRTIAAKNYCGGGTALVTMSTDSIIESLTKLGYTITLSTSELCDDPPREDGTVDALAVIRLAAARVWGDLTISTEDATARDAILCRVIQFLQRTR